MFHFDKLINLNNKIFLKHIGSKKIELFTYNELNVDSITAKESVLKFLPNCNSIDARYSIGILFATHFNALFPVIVG